MASDDSSNSLQNAMLICVVILLTGIFIVVIYQLIVSYRSSLKYYKCVNGSCKRSIDPKDYASKNLCKAKCGSGSSASEGYKAAASEIYLSNFSPTTLYLGDTEMAPNQTATDFKVTTVDPTSTSFNISPTQHSNSPTTISIVNEVPQDTGSYTFTPKTYTSGSTTLSYYAVYYSG